MLSVSARHGERSVRADEPTSLQSSHPVILVSFSLELNTHGIHSTGKWTDLLTVVIAPACRQKKSVSGYQSMTYLVWRELSPNEVFNEIKRIGLLESSLAIANHYSKVSWPVAVVTAED